MSEFTSKRWFTMVPTAVLALSVLAACGGSPTAPAVTEAPAETATEAPAAEATEAPAEEATPAIEATEAPAEEATPAAEATDAAAEDATPAAAAAEDATPAAMASDATPAAAGEATPVAGTPAAGATPEASGETAAQEVTVTSFDIYFEPKEVTIPADTDVTFLLPNEGAAAHNFAIDELDISVDQAPGGRDYETIINAPAGEYEYYCNVPGHKQAGMVGTLTVE
jgi:plastocyanin